MKIINFVKPQTKADRDALKYWYYFTSACALVTFIIIFFFECKQLINFFNIKKEYDILANYIQGQSPLLKKRKDLIDLHDNLRNKADKLSDPDRFPHNIFLLIAQLIPDECHLTKINYQRKKRLILEGVSLNSNALTNFFRKLVENDRLPYSTLNKVTNGEKGLLNFEIHIEL